jgi:hypothetical protein
VRVLGCGGFRACAARACGGRVVCWRVCVRFVAANTRVCVLYRRPHAPR